jgi:hypothetical protein
MWDMKRRRYHDQAADSIAEPGYFIGVPERKGSINSNVRSTPSKRTSGGRAGAAPAIAAESQAVERKDNKTIKQKSRRRRSTLIISFPVRRIDR